MDYGILLLIFVAVTAILALWIPRVRLKRAIDAPFPNKWVQMLENIDQMAVHLIL